MELSEYQPLQGELGKMLNLDLLIIRQLSKHQTSDEFKLLIIRVFTSVRGCSRAVRTRTLGEKSPARPGMSLEREL